MPFGISSVPQVFQRQMHELIEGLSGVEVVAEDLVTVAFDGTEEGTIASHDHNIEAFLKRCKERNLKLNHKIEAPPAAGAIYRACCHTRGLVC